jgi:hypothetical protein
VNNFLEQVWDTIIYGIIFDFVLWEYMGIVVGRNNFGKLFWENRFW